MSKYLVYSGLSCLDKPTIESLLVRKHDFGGNTGNLLFINAVTDFLDIGDIEFVPTRYRAKFSESEIDIINSNYSAFILPLADAFREENIDKLEQLTQTIRRLSIPCVVIGVGLRAPLGGDINISRKIDPVVFDFVKAVLSRSTCIGIRGDITGKYLNRLGFSESRDYEIIGCPSMALAASGGIKIREISLTQTSKIALNANTLADDNVNGVFKDVVNNFDDVYLIQQKEEEIKDIYAGIFSEIQSGKLEHVGSIFGDEVYHYLLREDRVKAFPSLSSWVSFLRSCQLCLNNRFHGTVASIMAGTPSIIIPIDSRMDELVRYHNLTSCSIQELGRYSSLFDLVSRLDFKAPERVAEENKSRFLSFLDLNDLPHKDGNITSPLLCQESDQIDAADSFYRLSLHRKIYRICHYYMYRIYFQRANKKFEIKN